RLGGEADDMNHAGRRERNQRRRAAPLVVLAAFTMLVTACGGGGGDGDDAEESKTPKGVKTAWEKVLDGVDDDGTVSKETALAAFSLAIAPLPGVKVPDGPPGPIPDGWAAIAWVVRQYDQLTPEQQRAVGDALSGEGASDSEEGGHSLRAPGFLADVQLAVSGSTPKGCYGETVVTRDSPGSEKYRALVD